MRIAQILEQMVAGGLLIRAGYCYPSLGGLGDHYFFVSMQWDSSRGDFKLARTLGAEFLY